MRQSRLPVDVTFYPIASDGKNAPSTTPFLPVNQFGIRQLFPLVPKNPSKLTFPMPKNLLLNAVPSVPAPTQLDSPTAFNRKFPVAEAVPTPLDPLPITPTITAPINSVIVSNLATTVTANPVTHATLNKTSPASKISFHQDIDPLDETPKSLWDRIVQAFLVTLTYAGVGLLIDGMVNLVKAMTSPITTQTFWLFLPLLAGLGLVLGIVFGTRAIDVILIPFRTRDTPAFDEADVGYDMMRAVGIGLGIAVVGWLILMVLT